MGNESSVISRAFRITPFLYERKPRYLFQNAETFEPSVAVSLYEQWLSRQKGSPNSVRNDLNALAPLFTWALLRNIDIEEMLLKGLAPTPVQVRMFAHWLSKDCPTGAGTGQFSISRFNRILEVSSAIFAWFIMQYGQFEGAGNRHALEREQVATYVEKQFASHKRHNRKNAFAGDLSEDEIATIEQFLKPSNRIRVNKAVAVRDYLLWRLAIEFGFREGEILALRLCDCPHGRHNYLKIVRVEERGEDYFDPRGSYAPRPKTLSRDLGFILDNSPIPGVIDDYVNEHRCRRVDRNGRMVKQPVLDHDFLLLEHKRNSGDPLSSTGVQKIAKAIRENTGIAFHWHLTRHAFFNRTYAAVLNHPDSKAKLEDLVYFGGWASEKSLLLYVNRARRERATTALAFWQTGMNHWDALQ